MQQFNFGILYILSNYLAVQMKNHKHVGETILQFYYSFFPGSTIFLRGLKHGDIFSGFQIIIRWKIHLQTCKFLRLPYILIHIFELS